MSKSSTGIVSYHHDPGKPIVLSSEEEEAWRHLQQMSDEEIDYSDIPNQSGTTGWRRVSDLVPEENKQQITLRLDAEVLAFFKSTGRRYQSRINAALREYMLAHRVPR
jgi:uncharacterized protein (DUF4415 family)